MFPMEKPSMLHTIARGAMGQGIPAGSLSMMNLLDEKSLDQLAESTGARLWKGFMSFGSASAGILGVFIIIRLVKLIADTLIHGYALHSMYGWSLHLLGAIWTSVTNVLLHLGRPQGDEQNRRQQQPPRPPSPTEESPPQQTPSTTETQHPRAPPRVNNTNPESAQLNDVTIDNMNYKDLRELLHEEVNQNIPHRK